MTDPSIAISSSSFSPPAASTPVPIRPIAGRTKLLLEGPVLSTLLRLSAPNVLNLLAIAGMITFDGLFLGRLGADVLAGASLAFPFVMVVQHAANGGVGGGVSSAIARALGSGRRDRPHIPFGSGSDDVFLHSHAAGSASHVSLDGWTGRNAVSRPLLFERRVRRRRVDLDAQSARWRRAGNGKHGPAFCRDRQQRACSRSYLAVADLRSGTGARTRSGRRRLGPDDTVRRRQSRADRIFALFPFAHQLSDLPECPFNGSYSPKSSR